MSQVAGTLAASAHPSGFNGRDAERNNLVTHTLTAEGHDASEDGTGRGTPLAVSLRGREPGNLPELSDKVSSLRASQGGSDKAHVLAFAENQRAEVVTNDTVRSLTSGGGKPGQGYPAVLSDWIVRRLTPTECARLQGFPDDWLTLDPALSDSTKYRVLGDAVCVNVTHWLGERINAALCNA